jgi:hypothetical protein
MSEYIELKKLLRRYAVAEKKISIGYPAYNWALNHHRNSKLEPMTFEDAWFLLPLYKNIGKWEQFVVQKSVQCGLSELFIIQSHYEASLGMSVMYVLPKYELRNRFVNNRIYKLHKKVPWYTKLVAQAGTSVHRTSLMHFGRGTLIYVGSNVEDEFIEVPVDSAYVDEKDRCNHKNLLMLPDRYSASKHKFHREISNPTVDKYGINARYRESSQGLWNYKCDHCGHYFTPDFFKHVVREVGDRQFEVIDPAFDLDLYRKKDRNTDVRVICDKCERPVNRLMKGEWVHGYPTREWIGVLVSKIFSRNNTLYDLVVKWEDGKDNEYKRQVFFNSDLGLTYSGEGNQITEGMMAECAVRYSFPVRQVDSVDTLLMGVDVGAVLNYVIRRRVKVDTKVKLQLIELGTVPSFTALGDVIRKWKPKRVVVDAQPEIHKIMELKADFPGKVFSARFAQGTTALSYNKQRREYSMDRTASLDYVLEYFTTKTYLLPLNFRDISGGTYKSQMIASSRILDTNEEHPEKSRFDWVHTDPDHYFLAEAYLVMAHLSLPMHDLFEFFEKEVEVQRQTNAYDKAKFIDAADREAVAEAMRITPQVFLDGVRRQDAVKKDTLKPRVDEREIRRAIDFFYKQQGYVDLKLCANMCHEHEDDVKRWLKIKGFSESNIKGQYIK